jgi:hypothetical protein
MNQDPNPTDYPHLEAFVDWLYEHVEELPCDTETLKKRVQSRHLHELDHVERHSGDGGEGLSDWYRSLEESRAEEANTRQGQATVPCGICGRPTPMRGTKRCDRCWELETRIEAAPEIAKLILRGMENGGLSPELEEVERNQLQSKRDAEEKEFYENERSRAATADYEYQVEENLDE